MTVLNRLRHAGERHAQTREQLLRSAGTAGNLTTDAPLAASDWAWCYGVSSYTVLRQHRQHRQLERAWPNFRSQEQRRGGAQSRCWNRH